MHKAAFIIWSETRLHHLEWFASWTQPNSHRMQKIAPSALMSHLMLESSASSYSLANICLRTKKRNHPKLSHACCLATLQMTWHTTYTLTLSQAFRQFLFIYNLPDCFTLEKLLNFSGRWSEVISLMLMLQTDRLILHLYSLICSMTSGSHSLYFSNSACSWVRSSLRAFNCFSIELLSFCTYRHRALVWGIVNMGCVFYFITFH